jgi:ferritin-like metal-binding protein YciE
MPTNGLHELFARGLQYLYSAHQQGAKQASANYETSSAPRLKHALRAGCKLNLKQAKRLEKVLETVNVLPNARHDHGMQGIAEANNAMIAETGNPAERDLINIALGQTAAHFYIAKYGTLRSYAQALGNHKAAALLQKTLDETEKVNSKFNEIAREIVRKPHHNNSEASVFGQVSMAVAIVALIAVAAKLAGQPGPSSRNES